MTDETITTSSNEVLEHELKTIAAQIAAATCRFLLLVAELDRREAWGQHWGCTSMAHWLSWQCSLSPVTAREHVRVARSLAGLPLMTETFGRGELSYSKVRALVRIITPESEQDLVALARTATAAQLERIISATELAASDPRTIDERRELVTSADGMEGLGIVRARLRIDELVIVQTALAKAMQPDDDSAESSIAQRSADAFVRVCEAYIATGDAARAPSTRNSAVIHVEVGPDGVESAQTERGVPVHPETARRMLCDAAVQGMLGDCNGPIGVGRQTRTINRRMRRALQKRSGGTCEWIGCQRQTYLDGHHVRHWEDGGPTELWNLVHLCWHHHHLVHEGGWRLEHDGCGGVRCFRPGGGELRHAIPAMTTEPLVIEAEADALLPLWAGERFDLSACVDAALEILSPTR